MVFSATVWLLFVCLKPLLAGRSYDCGADLADIQQGWSVNKRIFCCRHERVGCEDFKGAAEDKATSSTEAPRDAPASPTPAPSTTAVPTQAVPRPPPVFTCGGSDAEIAASWTETRKAFCCLREQRGCPHTKTFSLLDCKECDAAKWSLARRRWCCAHSGLACPSPRAALPHLCVGSGEAQAKWSAPRRKWCCARAGVSCGTSVSTAASAAAPYKCTGGGEWTKLEKEWCCQHHGKGCTRDHQARDCDTVCSFKNEEASCSERMDWLVKHSASKCD